jgi:sugar phosphate isomerase/epimerase
MSTESLFAALIDAYRNGGRGALDLTGEAREEYVSLEVSVRKAMQDAAKAVLEAEADSCRAAEEAAAVARKNNLADAKEATMLEDLQGLIEHIEGYPQEVDPRRALRQLESFGLSLECDSDGYYRVVGDVDAAIRRIAPRHAERVEARRAAPAFNWFFVDP